MASSTVAVRLSDEVLEKLTNRAEKAGQSVSEWVRQLIQMELSVERDAVEQAVPDDICKRLDALERLAKKATKAAARAQFLATLSVNWSSQTARVAQGAAVPTADEQSEYMTKTDLWAEGFAAKYLEQED